MEHSEESNIQLLISHNNSAAPLAFKLSLTCPEKTTVQELISAVIEQFKIDTNRVSPSLTIYGNYQWKLNGAQTLRELARNNYYLHLGITMEAVNVPNKNKMFTIANIIGEGNNEAIGLTNIDDSSTDCELREKPGDSPDDDFDEIIDVETVDEIEEPKNTVTTIQQYNQSNQSPIIESTESLEQVDEPEIPISDSEHAESCSEENEFIIAKNKAFHFVDEVDLFTWSGILKVSRAKLLQMSAKKIKKRAEYIDRLQAEDKNPQDQPVWIRFLENHEYKTARRVLWAERLVLNVKILKTSYFFKIGNYRTQYVCEPPQDDDGELSRWMIIPKIMGPNDVMNVFNTARAIHELKLLCIHQKSEPSHFLEPYYALETLPSYGTYHSQTDLISYFWRQRCDKYGVKITRMSPKKQKILYDLDLSPHDLTLKSWRVFFWCLGLRE